MAQDIAKVWDAKLDYVEFTYGNSVLDLQSNKVDLAFALNPTPQRALSIGFTHPMIIHPFGCLAKKGFDPKTWDDINKPEIRVVFDIGSCTRPARGGLRRKRSSPASRRATNASSRCNPAAPTSHILAAMLGLSTVGKNPALGPYHLLRTRRRAAKLSRRAARAGHPLRRGDQRLARL